MESPLSSQTTITTPRDDHQLKEPSVSQQGTCTKDGTACGPKDSPAWDSVIIPKGDLIAGGVSGIVELSPSGYAIKSPWPGAENADCRADLTLEAQIYDTLGQNERFVKIQHWDPAECVLTMEYMTNGCLKDYINQHYAEIMLEQRLQWCLDAAEGLQLLHDADVIYCDMKPKNLLLDANLRVKLADFGSSSFRGSKPTGCAGTRYMPPDDYTAFSIRIDIFGLGSTMYKIMTGKDPYKQIPSGEVWPLYRKRQFPDVSKLLCGNIIQDCWLGRVRSAKEVYNAIRNQIAIDINIGPASRDALSNGTNL